MRNTTLRAGLIAALFIGILLSPLGFAGNHSRAGGMGAGNSEHGEGRADERRNDNNSDRASKQKGSSADERGDGRSGSDTPLTRFFSDQHREISRTYYRQHYSDMRCPPGLAKKNNGCMPPGQAKKWSMGQPLPRNVIYHDLPPALFQQLGAPPPRQRYARVDSDILLIEIGTGIVLDVIESLGW